MTPPSGILGPQAPGFGQGILGGQIQQPVFAQAFRPTGRAPGGFMGRNEAALVALAAGLINGPNASGGYNLSGMPQAIQADRARQRDAASRNATVEYLKKRGDLSPEEMQLIAERPELVGELWKQKFAKPADQTATIENYKFYSNQELAAGRTPLPFGEWTTKNSPSGGAGGSATERIAAALMQDDPSLSYAEAIQKAQRAEPDDSLRRENMALDAALEDVRYTSDPVGTIEKYRKFYGLDASGEEGDDAATPDQPTSDDRSRRKRRRERRQAVAQPRPFNVPPGSAYSPSRKVWRTPDGQMFDATGQPVSPALY